MSWDVGVEVFREQAAPLTLTDVVRYQGASGDMNPLHHDPAVAAAAGLPGPLAIGMRQVGVLASYLTRTFGEEGLTRLSVRFLNGAFPGQTLEYWARVTAVISPSLLELAVGVLLPDGHPHVEGHAVVRCDGTVQRRAT